MLTLLSPAKLNLFLHITGKRSDGYHLLETEFVLINLYDTLVFKKRLDDTVLLEDQTDIKTQDNLIYRAAKALSDYCNEPLGAEIRLDKKIPCGAGLGGGSSNAATTLLALNHLYSLNLNVDSLIEIGATLGADVPVFIGGSRCFATGIGDKLHMRSNQVEPIAVFTPKVHCDTASLFQAPKLVRDKKALAAKDYDWRAQCNVFEPIVRDISPDIDHLFNALNAANLASGTPRLTGTGSSVFIVFENTTELLANMTKMRRIAAEFTDCRLFFCETLDRSPVHETLDLK